VVVAGYEVMRSCQNYTEGMNLPDIASYGNADVNMYCLILILCNLAFLPSAIMLYKQNGISLRDEIYSKKTLGKDILLGLVLVALSGLLNLLTVFIPSGKTELASEGWHDLSTGTVVLLIIALVFVSGICKEIYFRGLAKNFCGSILGETAALLLFNVMFGVLDWYNLGLSFVLGLLWIWGYKKSHHLIVPMIAHGGVNLLAIIYHIVM
jgi:hypothetical protein